MRISDWSSDVCSSDLFERRRKTRWRNREANADRDPAPRAQQVREARPGQCATHPVGQAKRVFRIGGAQDDCELLPAYPPDRVSGCALVFPHPAAPDQHPIGSDDHTTELPSLMPLSYPSIILIITTHIRQCHT